MNYIYFLLILLIFFLLIFITFINIKRLPIKVKVGTCICTSLFFMKIAALCIFSISNNLKLLNAIKPLYYSDYVAVPCAFILCLYILTKSVNFDLNYLIGIEIIVSVIYFMCALQLKSTILLEKNNFYVLRYDLGFLFNIAFVAINFILLFICYKKYCTINLRKKELYLLFISALAMIFEIYLKIFHYDVLSEPIIGDLLYIISLYYSINTLRIKS